MNIIRFLKKCLNDRPAAVISAKIVLRSLYAKLWWSIYPNKPLVHNLLEGGRVLLWKNDSFTTCLYPSVETYEIEVKACMKQVLKEGSVFIDIGANIGYYSVLAKQIVGSVGKVISVEPNPDTFNKLKLNCNKNSIDSPIQCAIDTECGEIELFVPVSGDIWASVNKNVFQKGQQTYCFKVVSLSIDKLVEDKDLKQVDLIKIDIEGGELNALISAKKVLQQYRPVVIIEYSKKTWLPFGASPELLKVFLEDIKYQVFQFDKNLYSFKSVDEKDWESQYVNLILSPNENLH